MTTDEARPLSDDGNAGAPSPDPTDGLTSHREGVAAQPRSTSPRWRGLLATALAAILIAAAYGAFQRIATTAHVETVEFTRNLGGGFLAIGYADGAPGFVLLSALERDRVTIAAERSSSLAGGTHTTVSVSTPAGVWVKRLRGPVVVTVDDTGEVVSDGVAWSFADFQELRETVECAHAEGKHVRRCGAPFADLHHLLQEWPSSRVPLVIRDFLDRHARPSGELAGEPEAKHAHPPFVP